jgi:hypothetical protein
MNMLLLLRDNQKFIIFVTRGSRLARLQLATYSAAEIQRINWQLGDKIKCHV